MDDTRRTLIDGLEKAMREYHRLTNALDGAVADRFGINRTDLRCLDLLYDSALPAGRLAELIGLSPAAMTTLIDRLEAKGYVQRVRDSVDRRRVLVGLTERARRLSERMYEPLELEGAKLLERYSGRELRLLRGYLRSGSALTERHLSRVREEPID